MMDYTGLRVKLAEKNLKWKYLREDLHIHPKVIANINKGEYVSMDILVRICNALDCQIGDIVKIKRP